MQLRKRIAQAAAAAGLALVLTAGTAFASCGTGVVTASSLRVRSKPSTSSGTLICAPEGAKVELLSGEEDGWYKVCYKNRVGYMSAEWLRVSSAADSSAADSSSDSSSESSEGERIGVVNAGPLNVRSGPGTQYSKVGSLKKGTSVTVTGSSGTWYQITSGSVSGYVSGKYITLSVTASVQTPELETETGSEPAPDQDSEAAQPQRGLVTTSSLNVRSGPGTQYSKVGSLKKSTVITVTGTSDGWYQITSGSLSGYVSSKYVTLLGEQSSSPVGEAAAELAKSLLGKSYVYGAAGPNSFDCSGLVYYIYRQLGCEIKRSASQQYLYSGEFISIDELEPGDLIFIFNPKYDKSGGTKPVTHVAMYVGNDQYIHASTSGYCVKYGDLYGSQNKYMVGFKRIR